MRIIISGVDVSQRFQVQRVAHQALPPGTDAVTFPSFACVKQAYIEVSEGTMTDTYAALLCGNLVLLGFTVHIA